MKRKVKWIMAALIFIVSCFAYGAVLLKPVFVEAEVIAKGNLDNTFTVQGTILPVREAVLNSVSGGEVVNLPVQAGTSVKEGDVLVEMGFVSQTELELQREQYRQQLFAARQQYDRMFGSQGSEAARLAAAERDYGLAEKNYENSKILFEQGGFISQAELDTLKAQRDSAYQARQQAREDNTEGTRTFYKTQINSYEKQLAMIEDTVSPGTVKMPFDGVVWEVYADVGKYMAPNQPAVKVYARGDMKIQASLLSEDSWLIREGQDGVVKYADGTQETAKVSFVSEVAVNKPSTIGTEENRCNVELRPGAIPSQAGAGQQVDVTFTVVTAVQVLTVPSTATVFSDGGSIVYVIKGGKAEMVRVETGKKSGGRVEILAGIEEGDMVITDPYNAKIKEGSRVSAD